MASGTIFSLLHAHIKPCISHFYDASPSVNCSFSLVFSANGRCRPAKNKRLWFLGLNCDQINEPRNSVFKNP